MALGASIGRTAKMVFKNADEAAKAAAQAAESAQVAKTVKAVTSVNKGQSKGLTALTVAAFGAGGMYGVGRGVRKTMIDMNKSLGNPVGFSYDYAVNKTFDKQRKSANNYDNGGTMGLTTNLPKRSRHIT